MKIDYYIVDPTRNTTILADGNVPVAKQQEIANRLMEKERIAEQVGFVSLAPKEKNIDVTLRMAGGEFCGNATMSAAALFCDKARLPRGEECDVNVRASGAAEPVKVHINVTESGRYHGTVNMPSPKSIEYRDFSFNGQLFHMPVVSFEGISHIIAEELRDREYAEQAVKQWCAELGCDALGLMLYDAEQRRLDPVVYVPAADTLFWESSCASGTTAVGAWLADKSGEEINMKLTEPGGELVIEAVRGGKLRLSGHVRILRRVEGIEI